MIVIEGLDNSGKSTLARIIAHAIKLEIQESEGPPKSEGEIEQRIVRYLDDPNKIYVRHPVISNPIYSQAREDGWKLDPDLRQRFYDIKPLLIYCDPGTRGLGEHKIKDHDTEAHLAIIANNYTKLLFLYRNWACDHAHVIYRIGNTYTPIITMCELWLGRRA